MIYVIVNKCRGPHGHGEPGIEYYALHHNGHYDWGKPSPAFRNPSDAEKYMIENEISGHIILELEIK